MNAHGFGTKALGGFVAAVLLVAAPTGAVSQEVSAGWLPFLGCWESVEGEEGLLCVRPAEDGVEMFTIAGGEITTSDVLSADGTERPRSAEGCEGWESGHFSDDGRRVFTRSEFVCGEELPRTATGVLSMVTPTEFLDVRSVEIDGESVAWVQRYRLVGPERMAAAGIEDIVSPFAMSVRTARMAASRAISVEQVSEAVEAVDPKAVEAWVAARGERFDLNAEELVRIADSGVPESVIDVMVAVSFPEYFSIDGQMAEARGVRGGGGGRSIYDFDDPRCRSGFYGVGRRSLSWNPFYYGYGASSCYGAYYRSPYGYGYGNPYSYGYGSGYGYGYGGYYPTTVIVDRATPASSGRAVNGRGYTRGSSGSGGAVRGSAGPSRTSGGSASSAPRSGGASSQPASRGSTGRKAKPRGGR